MYVYMCVYVRQALGPITPLHEQMVLSQQVLNLYLPGKETLERKKHLLLRSELEPGSDALQTTAFTTEPMGLWQLWTSKLALILLTVAMSVDYSERP